ncbi:hypothetical protein [Mariniblastus fucicola]|uniref:DUF4064 domain-containing protein n=1 Tax=Mariniblastus fucicola TaxID=980251 RepID=A0A5B9P2Z2_9BACT|nr:hypothetical protein [Mariniblastus fucicola]QEG20524.1 hypothetical protein MFFC18_03730 [Mariniblastus fucicola]
MSYNPYQQNPTTPVPLGRDGKTIAAEKVKTPAILLMVIAAVSMVSSVFMGGSTATIYLGMQDEIMKEFENNPPDPELTPEMMEMTVNAFGWGGVAFAVLAVLANVIVIFGAVRMLKLRSWSFAMFAVFLAMVPCFQGCCLATIPVGIYAMIVLFDENVKSSFQ